MFRNPRNRLGVAIAALISIPALSSSASAALFYSATGFPNQAVTSGYYAYPSETTSTFFYADAQPISLSTVTHVDSWSIVASTDDFDWATKALKINIWGASGAQTKEQMFDADPNTGNVISLADVSVASSQSWGASSISALLNYYATLQFSAFDLSAGSYLFSVQEQSTGGSWGIAESGNNLGSGILSSAYGSHEMNTQFGGTTGTLAMDIGGSTVPEPASLGMFALTSLAFLSRRRRNERPARG